MWRSSAASDMSLPTAMALKTLLVLASRLTSRRDMSAPPSSERKGIERSPGNGAAFPILPSLKQRVVFRHDEKFRLLSIMPMP